MLDHYVSIAGSNIRRKILSGFSDKNSYQRTGEREREHKGEEIHAGKEWTRAKDLHNGYTVHQSKGGRQFCFLTA